MPYRRIARWVLIPVAAIALLAVLGLGGLLLLVDPASRAAALPTRVEASPLSRYVTVPLAGTDGITLHYLETGQDKTDGPVFLLLHGFTFNAFTWHAQLRRLSGYGRVIAIDQLPYGLSEKVIDADVQRPGPYGRDAAVALVRQLLDALAIERVVIVGNSSGGTLAAEFALAHPTRVQGLVLIAPWVYVTRPVLPGWLADSPPLQRLALLAARHLGEQLPLVTMSFKEPLRLSADRMRLARIHMRTRNWDLAWAALLNVSLGTRISLAAAIDRLTLPVLVLSGDSDRIVAVDDSRRLAGELRDADFRLLIGCGHAAHEECPGAFTVALDEWLQRHRIVTPSSAAAEKTAP